MKTKGARKLLYYSTTLVMLLGFGYLIVDFSLDKYYLDKYNEVNKNISPISVTEEVAINDTEVNNTTTVTNEVVLEDNNTNEIKTLDDYRNEYNNTEIVGKISILNDDFSLLLVQGNDNSYYLNHLVNKNENKLGATFVDYRVDFINSKKINIYGHNNGKYSVSFNKLMAYLEESYYNNHKFIQIETDLGVELYEIFSIQIVSNNKHMQVDFTNLEWYLYLKDIIDNSIYSTDTAVDEISKMITLQTCTNNKDNEFLLVHGRKIEN